MKLEWRAPRAEDIQHILDNLRVWDRQEIFALQRGDDDRSIAWGLIHAQEMGRADVSVGHLERPVVCIVTAELRPGVWSLSTFTSDEWLRVATAVTKHLRRVIIPGMWARGAHRIQCQCMDGNPAKDRWLLSFGAEREGPHLGYGRDQETFYTWALRPGKEGKNVP